MIKVKNTNAKKEYLYMWDWYNNINPIDICGILEGLCVKGNKGKVGNGKENNLLRHIPRSLVGSKKYGKLYLNIPLSFDIETTTKYKKDTDGKCCYSFATMYVWQCCIGSVVIMGNSWAQWIELLSILKDIIVPRDNMRVICWIHNLNYEMSFMRKWLNITDSFLRDTRSPLYIEHDNFIEFRDSMAMTNSTLKRLAHDFTNTQKCSGDLDYNIERNTDDALNLNEVELSYCHNDVLILSEWATYYWNEYLIKHFAPLTISSVLRNEIKEEATNEEYKKILSHANNSQPQTEDFYNYLTNQVYRGGYSHANMFIVGDVFTKKDNIKGWDFTSSYPSVMNLEYFPFHFYEGIPTKEYFERVINNYCVIFTATFKNIKSKCGHSIESKHKCIQLEGATIDNGHVRNAKLMKVAICELDYYTYCDFYEWDSMVIDKIYVAEREKMPRYITKPMNAHYLDKYYLKIAGKPYALEKSKVNTYYGVQVTRRPVIETKLTNDGIILNPVKTYDEWKSKQILLAQQGVYVSAHARRNLLKNVALIENNPYNYTPVLYCDTDSIKVAYCDDYVQEVINTYNREIQQKLVDNGLTDVAFNDLGMFDYEYGEGSEKGEVIAFKTLGAKRYLITARNKKGVHTNPTIAGLPKNALADTWANWLRWYRELRNGMKINNCKLTAIYHDEPTEDIIHGKYQRELSSVALVPINFKMSLDDAWAELLINKLDEDCTLEKRGIYETIRKD